MPNLVVYVPVSIWRALNLDSDEAKAEARKLSVEALDKAASNGDRLAKPDPKP